VEVCRRFNFIGSNQKRINSLSKQILINSLSKQKLINSN
jgi:hypothetical protein